jgi:hypothetical protein
MIRCGHLAPRPVHIVSQAKKPTTSATRQNHISGPEVFKASAKREEMHARTSGRKRRGV